MATSDPRLDELDELLDSLPSLTDDDVALLADLWRSQDADARKRAWARAKTAIDATGHGADLDDARQTITGWMTAGKSDYQGIQGLLGAATSGAGARQEAAPALIDAAVAILAGGRLTADESDVLLTPWRTVLEANQSSA